MSTGLLLFLDKKTLIVLILLVLKSISINLRCLLVYQLVLRGKR